jgi:hypothetical protein
MRLPRQPYSLLLPFLLLVLSSCSLLGVATPQTFNERLGAGYSTVTASRDATATLLSSGKLSASDAQNVQDQLNTARTGLDLARQVHATNPPAGDAKLDAVVTGLTALQAYLQSRTKGLKP